jgi:hypothetical protein
VPRYIRVRLVCLAAGVDGLDDGERAETRDVKAGVFPRFACDELIEALAVLGVAAGQGEGAAPWRGARRPGGL